MKKNALILASIVGIIVMSGCNKESESAGEANAQTASLRITIANDTKTGLGEKEGTSYPNYWKAGDKVSVSCVLICGHTRHSLLRRLPRFRRIGLQGQCRHDYHSRQADICRRQL